MLQQRLSGSKPEISPKPPQLIRTNSYSKNNEHRRQEFTDIGNDSELLKLQELHETLVSNHEMIKSELEEISERLQQLSEVSIKLCNKYKTLKSCYEKQLANENRHSRTENYIRSQIKNNKNDSDTQPHSAESKLSKNDKEASLRMAIISEIQGRQEARKAANSLNNDDERKEKTNSMKHKSIDMQIEEIKCLLEEEIPTPVSNKEEKTLENKAEDLLDTEIQNHFIMLKTLQEKLVCKEEDISQKNSKSKEKVSKSKFYVNNLNASESEYQDCAGSKIWSTQNIPPPHPPTAENTEPPVESNMENQELVLKEEPRQPINMMPEFKVTDKDEDINSSWRKMSNPLKRLHKKHKENSNVSWEEMKKTLAFFYWYYFLDEDENEY